MRLTAHSSDDQQTKYRSEEELAAEKSVIRCHASATNCEAGILTEEVEVRLSLEIQAAVDDATAYAEAQPDPDPTTAMDWVFAERWAVRGGPAWGFGTSAATPPSTAG